MQCFDTFRGFLHKIYAATMDGKGREGTYNFFSRRLGAVGWGRTQAGADATPLAPFMLHHWGYVFFGTGAESYSVDTAAPLLRW